MFTSALVMGILTVSSPTLSECSPDSQASIVGRATDVETGEFLYCEYHFIAADGQTTTVEYRKDSSRLFAKKLLRYSGDNDGLDLARPEVEQEDFRIGEKRQALWRGDDMLLRYKSSAQQPWREIEVASRRIDVVDGGFDVVVRDHWDELVSGKPFVIDFASPVHQRSIKLQVVAKERADCDTPETGEDIADDRLQCFFVEPKNRLLRWFVDPLQLVYDRRSRRLHQYFGVVNVVSGEGEAISARITYYYNS
ncbi:hypothetical protein FKG94_10425 [Exilibacterium tricleocarpae]|uniref:DUF3108 domain-containing protein n=1 Tax=Exilibacterium tricleocarpae TaxID=2591008 RepID=A0A545TS83_9GAMM|nr:hypothetical protein [Exilibacterium tricleocarpae]TQV80076.1 hypothetical protein FKG94_10425 [Exilibacterium tricleocarpae]